MGADRSAVDEPPVTNDRRTSYERRFVSESGSEDRSRIVVGIAHCPVTVIRPSGHGHQ
jgi:hypothetical protein